MHVIRINGGLGNQLFQYSFGLALQNSTKKIIKYDVFDLLEKKAITPRELYLDSLVSDLSLASHFEVKMYKINKIKNIPIFRNIFPSFFLENNYTFNNIFLKVQRPTYFEGYWQSYKYFEYVKKFQNFEINLKISDFSQLNCLPEIEYDSFCCIHIRRGDYLNLSSIYINLGQDYYQKGITYFKKNFGLKKFVIFSDDIQLAKKMFPNHDDNYIFIDNPKISDITQFKLMCRFKYFIIANSTYSWWAATLSTTDSNKIVAPIQWYQNNLLYPTLDLIPNSWITF